MEPSTVTKAASASSYTASAGNIVLGLTSNEWSIVAIITGILTGVATFAFSAWMQWRRDRREAAAMGEK